jgi:hypothetical protein
MSLEKAALHEGKRAGHEVIARSIATHWSADRAKKKGLLMQAFLHHSDDDAAARFHSALSAPASSVGSGRSTSSTKAMGALSPTRKPILRMRV